MQLLVGIVSDAGIVVVLLRVHLVGVHKGIVRLSVGGNAMHSLGDMVVLFKRRSSCLAFTRHREGRRRYFRRVVREELLSASRSVPLAAKCDRGVTTMTVGAGYWFGGGVGENEGFSEESPACCEFVESFKERNHNYGAYNAFGGVGTFHDRILKCQFIIRIGETHPARKLRLRGRNDASAYTSIGREMDSNFRLKGVAIHDSLEVPHEPRPLRPRGKVRKKDWHLAGR